jgi:2,3-bisphosphoglycerate-dependent phosphoglycerate mutase
MKLDNLSQQEVLELNIPNGVPIVYDVDREGNPISKAEL